MKSRNQSRIDAAVFRAVGFLCAASGFVVRFFDGTTKGNPLAYMDTQVSLIAALFFAALTALSIIRIKKEGSFGDSPTVSAPVHAAFFGLVLFDTVAFWAITAWLVVPSGFVLSPSNVLIHIFLPLIVAIDWVLFVPHGVYGFLTTLFAFVYPAVYYAIIIIIANSGYVFYEATFGEFYRRVVFPYYFLQANAVGGTAVAVLIAFAFAVSCYALTCAVFALDKLLAKDNGEKRKKDRSGDKAKKQKRR